MVVRLSVNRCKSSSLTNSQKLGSKKFQIAGVSNMQYTSFVTATRAGFRVLLELKQLSWSQSLYDVRLMSLSGKLRGHKASVCCLEVQPGSQILASGGEVRCPDASENIRERVITEQFGLKILEPRCRYSWHTCVDGSAVSSEWRGSSLHHADLLTAGWSYLHV